MSAHTLRIFNETRVRMPRKKMFSLYQDLFRRKGGLVVVGIGETFSRRLNQEHRNKDAPADVLSFPSDSGPSEIYINMSLAARRARSERVPVSRQVLFLYLHGMLHLLGYRHGKKMESLEDIYASKYM